MTLSGAIGGSLNDVVQSYASAVKQRPFLVNAACGACFSAIGDLSAQAIEKSGNPAFKYSSRRAVNIALIRAFLAVPWILFWYPILQNMTPGTDNISIAMRVLLDLMIGTPAMIFIVFTGNAVLTGQSPQDAIQHLRHQFLMTYKKGAQFWPAVHFFITYRMDLIYRPLFTSVANVYWNGVLSWSATRNTKTKKN